MKVTLDLSRLLQEGAISHAEHDRLLAMGRRDDSLVLVNVLIGFGVIAVAAGAVALIPSAIAGAVLGALLMAAGIAVAQVGPSRWGVLSTICILVASLLLGAGVVLLSQGVVAMDNRAAPPLLPLWAAFVLVSVLFAGCACLARSALLASLAVLMLFAALGGSTYYDAATYGLQVTQPFGTVVLFAALALAAHLLSRTLAPAWERLAVIVARTALVLVNLGFWIGSLWGDELKRLGKHAHGGVSAGTFAVTWALALIGAAVWAGSTGRRWVLNLAAVFGGIHFYTQWFERVGANPASLLFGGLLVLGGAVLLWRLNQLPAVRGNPA